MESPSEIGALIMEKCVAGDLAELKEIKIRVGNIREFRGICNAYMDFSNGQRVLHKAAEMGHFRICQFLIDKIKVQIDVLTFKGDTPLMVAVKEQHVSLVRYLIWKSSVIEVANTKGFTSLHYAIQKDNMELIKFLLERRAPVDVDSVDGTPLQCAANRGNVEAVKLLLGRKAKPNSTSFVFGSPLICAIKSQSIECVELLIEAEADTNMFYCGLTPLAHAAQQSDGRYLMRLLDAGANPNLLSTDQLKPIEHAALANKPDNVELLLPVTQQIPHYPKWTVDGIMKFCHTPEAETLRKGARLNHLVAACQLAFVASTTEDYTTVLKYNSESFYLDPASPKCLSNRSLSHACLGNAVHALRDVEEYISLEFPEGSAYRQLQAVSNVSNLFQRYHTASINFLVRPHIREFGVAFREALFEYYSWMYLMCSPQELMFFFQSFL